MNKTLTPNGTRVCILGASNKTDRYSYTAMQLLREQGYQLVLLHPTLSEIDGIPVFPNIADPRITADGPIDTLTVYVNPATLEESVDGIIKLHPRRVILNPGTESPTAQKKIEAAGIAVLQACTLILLRTNQF